MKKPPNREKVSMSVYLSPKCKQKLECLQQLYFISNMRFSLSEIVEEGINAIYAAAYLCQNNKFWKTFFLAGKFLDPNESSCKGIDEVLDIIQKKPAAAKEILNVPIEVKKGMVNAFADAYSEKAEEFKKKFLTKKNEDVASF